MTFLETSKHMKNIKKTNILMFDTCHYPTYPSHSNIASYNKNLFHGSSFFNTRFFLNNILITRTSFPSIGTKYFNNSIIIYSNIANLPHQLHVVSLLKL